MTLVDTSIWVRHFQNTNATLVALLEEEDVGLHPFTIGEIACGNLGGRDATLLELQRLPAAEIADEIEVRHVLEKHRLWGRGLGWVDVHLLAAANLAGWEILTADRAMLTAARQMGIRATES